MLKLAHGLLCVLLAPALLAQGPSGGADVFSDRSAGREARLAAGAKREGRVVLYTSLAPTESAPFAAAFEKKYGVKVELWRALSGQVVQRTITEAQARRYVVDAIETNGPEMEMLAREKLLAGFYSPHLADLPPASIPAHRLWFPDRMNFFVVGYNTAKVQRSQIPATYEGFVDPKWRGRIALEATDVEWMATLIRTWGNDKAMDFFRRLSALKPEMREGHVLLASLVAAGEVPVGLTLYSSNIIPLKRKGAPIDYVPVQPVVGRPQGIGIAKNAPHPNAALLFADYVLSPEGQSLFESMGRVPASTRVKTGLDAFPFVTVDPGIVLDESKKWDQLWRSFFVRK